jgi:dolichol kinase
MCGGDGLADIIGRRFGQTNPLPWNPEKSWAGTSAMFVFGLSMALCLLWYFSVLGYQNLEFSTSVGVLIVIAFVATVIESLPINKVLDDNLSVPGVAALLGTMLMQVIA